MKATYEMAEKVANYYCEVRALEDEMEASLREMIGAEEFDEGNHDGYQSHPDWNDRCEALHEEWDLTEEESELLSYALERGLYDYFCAEDVMSVL